jgi:hypothetical protein
MTRVKLMFPNMLLNHFTLYFLFTICMHLPPHCVLHVLFTLSSHYSLIREGQIRIGNVAINLFYSRRSSHLVGRQTKRGRRMRSGTAADCKGLNAHTCAIKGFPLSHLSWCDNAEVHCVVWSVQDYRIDSVKFAALELIGVVPWIIFLH